MDMIDLISTTCLPILLLCMLVSVVYTQHMFFTNNKVIAFHI